MPASFDKIKKEVLGSAYDLSVAFLSPAKMRLAMKYKKSPAAKVANVLAFPLSKHSGEILICKAAAKPYSVEYLFIHGLLHLKGLKHSATMDRIELKLLAKFGFERNEHHSNRNRHRHVSR